MHFLITLILALTVAATQPAVRLHTPPTMVITDVVRGGPPEIDAGHVVQMTPCQPDQNCPVWLAGHRSTHGSVFAAVANLEPGNVVVVVYGGQTYRYRVVDHVLVCCVGSLFTPTAPLTLQTSASNRRLHIVTAVRE